ncbi:Polysaccharide export outer membrane protein [hydrothermal vent metagenome]|uniref:Polysaccharide export outer membrane protein n=1 Tax=hydrothermal vent metagenome TaxID=652676 RepID=A0A1W1EHC0_9ZZZZ
MKNIIFILISLLLISCSNKHTLFQSKNIVSIKPNKVLKYKIMPNDRISITSYEYPKLTPNKINRDGLVVNRDGSISLPLIGIVKIAGLTEYEGARLLEKKYKKYLKKPSFNIEVTDRKVYILGEVEKAGEIKINREEVSIMEVIATAKGFTDYAIRDDVIILSQGDNISMRRVDLTNFTSLANSNIYLSNRDIVYVPSTKWKEFKIKGGDGINFIFNTLANVVSPIATIQNITK